MSLYLIRRPGKRNAQNVGREGNDKSFCRYNRNRGVGVCLRYAYLPWDYNNTVHWFILSHRAFREAFQEMNDYVRLALFLVWVIFCVSSGCSEKEKLIERLDLCAARDDWDEYDMIRNKFPNIHSAWEEIHDRRRENIKKSPLLQSS